MKYKKILKLLNSTDFLVIGDKKIIFLQPPDSFKEGGKNLLDQGKWTLWRKANYDYFKNLLSGIEGKILIELGTGPARFRALFENFEYVGVDHYPFGYVNVVADITKPLPFIDNCCDIVLLSNVLEHISNPEDVLKECYRILAPGGLVIGAVPFLLDIHQAPYDYLRYTSYGLQKLFEKTGFVDIEVRNLLNIVDSFKMLQNIFFRRLLKLTPSKIGKFLIILIFAFFESTIKVLQSYAILDPGFTGGYGFRMRKL